VAQQFGRFRGVFFHTVFVAAMGAEEFDPIQREHMGVDVYDGHHDLVSLVDVDLPAKD
jgi:hypothetical protein